MGEQEKLARVSDLVDCLRFWAENRTDLTMSGKATLLSMVNQMPIAHAQSLARFREKVKDRLRATLASGNGLGAHFRNSAIDEAIKAIDSVPL